MIIGLTGATGFIGQQLLKEYAQQHTFICASSQRVFDRFLQHENVRYVFSDYSEQSFKKVFNGCDCIVHLGAKRPNAESEKSIENYFENILVSQNLFFAANQLGIKNVVNASTRSVYSTDCAIPFTEELVAPLNNYGVAKLCVEELAHICNIKYGMHIKSLRIAQVMGLGEKEGFLLMTYFNKSVNGETLDVYGQGISKKEYIYIKDVTRAIMAACAQPSLSGSFNIGVGVAVTNLELAQVFCRVFKNKAGYRLLSEKKEDGQTFMMDVALAKEKLGFTAKYNLENALKDMKKDFEELS